jgi:hypothetical protein
MLIIAPVKNRALGEASHSTAEAGLLRAGDPVVGRLSRTAAPPGPSSTSRAISVGTNPGATVPTVMPYGASAIAIDCLNTLSPTFEVPFSTT